ncbi:MAG: DUF1003 domain-containing protein [Planctomycetia bacterium]|nr:DUF1003 domain-containing protein [Planctomycetia bacterium]
MPNTETCQVCGQAKPIGELTPGALVSPTVVKLIEQSGTRWAATGYICQTDLDRFRHEYIRDTLESERGELSSLESEVLRSLREQELLSQNLNEAFDRELTLGERVADKVATFGGSWWFISSFAAVCVAWMAVNAMLLTKPFDPFPFILLNLALSCLAAVQAPLILMSQRRQEDRDRMRAEHDYRVNLKAELEIRHLHAKLDMLLTHQWQRLLEIQRIQLDVLQEVQRALPPRKE